MCAAESHRLELEWLPGRFAVCRLPAADPLPGWALDGPFQAAVRTSDELSLIAPEERVPRGVRSESGWTAFRVRGPLVFDLTGVLASLTQPLAGAEVPIFSVSTFDTDYLLVRSADSANAVGALSAAGHRFVNEPPCA